MDLGISDWFAALLVCLMVLLTLWLAASVIEKVCRAINSILNLKRN